MQQPPVYRSDPQTAMAISEQPKGIELRPGTWKRIRRGFPVNDLHDSTACGNQECAVVAFGQRVDFGGRARQRNEHRRAGRPSPETGPRSCPEIAFSILK